MNIKRHFLSMIAATSALFGRDLAMLTKGGGNTHTSRPRSTGVAFKHHEDKAAHGTMSRRIARNYVMGRHKYS